MILGENIDSVYSGGKEIQRVYSKGMLVWEKEKGINYKTTPFTVCAVEDGVRVNLLGKIGWSDGNNQGSVGTEGTINYKYSINGGEWIQNTSDSSVYLNQNDTMRIISEAGYRCDIKGLSDVYGNIMSLRYGDKFNSKNYWAGNDPSDPGLFQYSDIRNAENLILPALDLGEWAYNCMFYKCEKLIAAPKILPATTYINRYCYDYMFYGCKNLTTAPKLPATVLPVCCYRSMFEGCTSLTTAPDLPATTLLSSCCERMFYGCKNLTSAPKLPALDVGGYCYEYMFKGCTSLTTPPELPATTVVKYCYHGMFEGCKNLTTAPKLPATTLGEYCYHYMFNGCTSLTTAPDLPATTLKEGCYSSMFLGCSKITKSPNLKAKTLVKACYSNMFEDCSSLNYIKCYATAPDTSSSDFKNCVQSMLYNVSTTGTIACKSALSYYFRLYVKPSGWTIEEF